MSFSRRLLPLLQTEDHAKDKREYLYSFEVLHPLKLTRGRNTAETDSQMVGLGLRNWRKERRMMIPGDRTCYGDGF